MLYLGINIGGTKCSAALGKSLENSAMELVAYSEPRATQEYEPLAMLDALCSDMQALLKQEGAALRDVVGVGVSCGGPLSSARGLILSPPNLPGWDEIPVVAHVQSKMSLPVWLCNDANAGALAEWLFGAGRGKSDLIFLTFGTGIGAGIIAGGRLITGASDMAGEIGHVRMSEYGPVGYGKMGSFEGFCSGTGIAQLARLRLLEELQAGQAPAMLQKAPLEEITALTVGESADQGDALALEVMRRTGVQLGKGLSILIDLLNPEIIVIGSIFVRCKHLLWPHAEEVIKREALSFSRSACRVVPAELAETIGNMAALSVAAYYSETY
ncbi:MAG: ROK family protein [Oscillospiraceae bacterium]